MVFKFSIIISLLLVLEYFSGGLLIDTSVIPEYYFTLSCLLWFCYQWICLITGPSTEPSVVESKDRKANAHFILKLLCDSVVLQPYLRELLSAK